MASPVVSNYLSRSATSNELFKSALIYAVMYRTLIYEVFYYVSYFNTLCVSFKKLCFLLSFSKMRLGDKEIYEALNVNNLASEAEP